MSISTKDFWELRDRVATGEAVIAKQAVEIAALKSQLAELLDSVTSADEPLRRGPGLPRKEAA